MSYREPGRAAACRSRSSGPATATVSRESTGMTIYGCGRDEADLFRMWAPHFGVVPTITEAAISTGDLALSSGNRCVSVDHRTPVDASTLLALSKAGVEYLSTRSVGRDHIDEAYADRLGITVENVAYSPDSVADYTLMLILMALRETVPMTRRADAGDYRLPDRRGRELRDLTVGVVGTGRIGRAVIDRLRGFGSRLVAYDPRPKTSATHVPLDDLLRRSDIVTLHAPLNRDTYHLLDRRRIGLMKPDAYLVNTGRGSLLDTEALIAALEGGRLRGAALDVVEGEEGIFYADCRNRSIDGSPVRRLQRLPGVVISPHVAFHTEHALHDVVEQTLVNCSRFESRRTHG